MSMEKALLTVARKREKKTDATHAVCLKRKNLVSRMMAALGTVPNAQDVSPSWHTFEDCTFQEVEKTYAIRLCVQYKIDGLFCFVLFGNFATGLDILRRAKKKKNHKPHRVAYDAIGPALPCFAFRLCTELDRRGPLDHGAIFLGNFCLTNQTGSQRRA